VTSAREDRPTTTSPPPEPPSIGEVVNLVKAYAEQETIGPLKGAGRWIGLGLAGAFALGIGGIIFLLGLLRLLQTEWERSATGSWSWVAYVIVLIVTAGAIALAASMIKKDSLHKPGK
jgi:hypothetical protein